jgi:thiamine-phosphate pyrophosphorylase
MKRDLVVAPNPKICRILDANANRAREGLRVVEEYLRLVLDNADFTARLKALRHRITGAVSGMNLDDELIACRDSVADVGATSPTISEGNRNSFDHVVMANLRRSQEALRVLEEYSKLLSAKASADFKQLRFETYALERDIRLFVSQKSRKRKRF